MAKYITVEEEVVANRWFTDVEVDGVARLRASANPCPKCGRPMNDHGWLLGRMEFVCPGKWIIADSLGDIFQMDDESFQHKYRRVE